MPHLPVWRVEQQRETGNRGIRRFAATGIHGVRIGVQDCCLTQSSTVCVFSDELNRWPSFQSPVEASFARLLALEPSGELADVQNGITVLSLKSLARAKAFTGYAASPHQIG